MNSATLNTLFLAVKEDDQSVEAALDALPSPPPPRASRPLLKIILERDVELAHRAAHTLRRIQHGAGMIFLLEAITKLSSSISLCSSKSPREAIAHTLQLQTHTDEEHTAFFNPPNSETLPELFTQLPEKSMLIEEMINLLDLANMERGWIRMRWVLCRVHASHRQQLVQRLMDNPRKVPAKHWGAFAESARGMDELSRFVELFGALGAMTSEEINSRQRSLAMSTLAETLCALLEPNENEEKKAAGVRDKLRAKFLDKLVILITRRDGAALGLLRLFERLHNTPLYHLLALEIRLALDLHNAHSDEAIFDTLHLSGESPQKSLEILQAALKSTLWRDIDEALKTIPRPPPPTFARPLLKIFRLMPRDSELCQRAIRALKAIPEHGGMIFLFEALLVPDLRDPEELIEALDLGHLSTGWIRLPLVLKSLDKGPRQQLIQRIVDMHKIVPLWRWQSIVLEAEATRDIPLILRHFQALILESSRDAARELKHRAELRILADALILRLASRPTAEEEDPLEVEANSDPITLQAAIVELLVEASARDATCARRLLRVLEQTTSGRLREWILLHLFRRAEVLADNAVDEAVNVLVEICQRRQEPAMSLALSILRSIPHTGSAADWEPLIFFPLAEARSVAMHALEVRESDVSHALFDLLRRGKHSASRRSVAESIGRRLSKGGDFQNEALEALCEVITQDSSARVAAGLDLHAIFHFAPERGAYFAALSALKSPHPILVDRVLKALCDDALRAHVIAGGSSEALATAASRLLMGPYASAHPLRLLLTLRLMKNLPKEALLEVIEPALAVVPLSILDRVVDFLRDLQDERWERHSLIYETLRRHGDAAAPLDQFELMQNCRAFWALRPAFIHEETETRVAALKFAAEMEVPEALPDLLASLDSSHEAVRIAAGQALVTLRHLGGLEPLEAAAKSGAKSAPIFKKQAQQLRRALAAIFDRGPFDWPEGIPPKKMRPILIRERPIIPDWVLRSTPMRRAWVRFWYRDQAPKNKSLKAQKSRFSLVTPAHALKAPSASFLWWHAPSDPLHAVGELTLSSVGLWLNTPLLDEVIFWHLSLKVSFLRAPLKDARSGHIMIVLRLEQWRRIQRTRLHLQFSAKLDPRLEALEEANLHEIEAIGMGMQALAHQDTPRLLAHIKWFADHFEFPLPLSESPP